MLKNIFGQVVALTDYRVCIIIRFLGFINQMPDILEYIIGIQKASQVLLNSAFDISDLLQYNFHVVLF